jgi:hypothetical protein
LLRDSGIAFVGGNIEMFVVNSAAPSAAELYDFATGFRQRLCVEWRGYSATANLFARRSVFADVGPFDGSVRAGGDRQWCHRALRKFPRRIYDARAIVRHPARTSQEEVFGKFRRGMAGTRDDARGLAPCLFTVFKQLVAPIIDNYALFLDGGRQLTASQKLGVFLFIWRVRLFAASQRLKFQFSAAESPRA